MKRLAALLLCACSLAVANPANPFGGTPPWTASVDAAKPLRLEIAYGELIVPPSANSDDPSPALDHVTPEFLAAAQTLRIALAPDDQGRVEMSGQLTAIYRLTTKDHTHSLDLNFALSLPNRREVTTRITLPLDGWIVMGGLTRTETTTSKKGAVTTTHKNLIVAVRLTSAQP